MKRGAKKILESIVLKHGGHTSPEDGLCAMEAVAYIAGEPHSDRPQCASPVLAAYVRALNDSMPDEERQRLKPYVLKLVKTANPELDQERARVLAWASITEFAPTALHAVGLVDHAETLKALPKYDWVQVEKAADAAAEAADAAEAAADAAYAAARAAYAAAEDGDAAERFAAADAAYAAARAAYAAAEAHDAAADAAYAAARAAKTNPSVNVWDLALAALDRALEVK